MTLGSLKVLPALRVALCARSSIKPVIYMYCILSGGSYIHVGGVEHNDHHLSVREATSLNTLATKILDSQAVMFLNRFSSLFAEVVLMVT